jgi:hypothetical protein
MNCLQFCGSATTVRCFGSDIARTRCAVALACLQRAGSRLGESRDQGASYLFSGTTMDVCTGVSIVSCTLQWLQVVITSNWRHRVAT